jgi:predicted ribonuclease YlaK
MTISKRNKKEKQNILRLDHLEVIQPKTHNQQITFDEYHKDQNLVLHGIAGTGKTHISLYLALQEVLDKASIYDDIFIVRSVVPTRDMGFLPGNESEKVAIYEAPYRSTCRELFSGIKEAYDMLKQQGTVKFISTSFVRGITLNNSIVIVDEIQNLTFHELDSIITRIGQDSKIIFCGDYTQSDLLKESDKRGILHFMDILKQMPEFSCIEFLPSDIVRSDFIKSYILTKNRMNYK